MTYRTIVFSLIMLVILGIRLINPVYASQQVEEMPKTPEINMESPTGESVSLSALTGKTPVLLVFWASWCTTCKEEIPRLSKLNRETVKVVAVNEEESAWKTKRYVSMNKIDYQVVLDTDGSVAKAFHVPGVPSCVILSKSGQIVYRGIGLPENIEAYAQK
jgi:thiol-disulfide isomerase/thioredoxin